MKSFEIDSTRRNRTVSESRLGRSTDAGRPGRPHVLDGAALPRYERPVGHQLPLWRIATRQAAAVRGDFAAERAPARARGPRRFSALTVVVLGCIAAAAGALMTALNRPPREEAARPAVQNESSIRAIRAELLSAN